MQDKTTVSQRSLTTLTIKLPYYLPNSTAIEQNLESALEKYRQYQIIYPISPEDEELYIPPEDEEIPDEDEEADSEGEEEPVKDEL